MSKTLNILNKVIGMVNKSEFINQIYSDLEGGEVEIFQADPATYAVGDRTSMEEGEVVLSDGSKLTIAEGKIAEISRSAEGDSEVVDAEFNEGPAPEQVMEDEVAEEAMDEEMASDEKMAEELIDVPAEEAAPAIEAPASDVPSSIIETKKETVTTKEVINMDVDAQEVAVAVEEEVEMKDEEVMADHSEEEMIEEKMDEHLEEEVVEGDSHQEAMDAMELRIKQLEDMIFGYESKFEALSKFENIATEAIDTLATNTVSNFKPEARVKVAPSANGSIFSQLKNKRGLK